VIGPIPELLGLVITYVGGISSASTNRAAARAFLAILTSPAAREKFKAAGL
jgi:ABC-type molybdate transport system substrate-binding protein